MHSHQHMHRESQRKSRGAYKVRKALPKYALTSFPDDQVAYESVATTTAQNGCSLSVLLHDRAGAPLIFVTSAFLIVTSEQFTFGFLGLIVWFTTVTPSFLTYSSDFRLLIKTANQYGYVAKQRVPQRRLLGHHYRSSRQYLAPISMGIWSASQGSQGSQGFVSLEELLVCQPQNPRAVHTDAFWQ